MSRLTVVGVGASTDTSCLDECLPVGRTGYPSGDGAISEVAMKL